MSTGSMSENDAEKAADALDEHLRHEPWYLSVGVGRTAEGPTLFVYSKNAKGPKSVKIGDRWMGFPLVLRVTGTLKRLTVVAGAA